MEDQGKTKEQLLNELRQLRQRVAELEGLEGERKRVKEAPHAEKPRFKTLSETAPYGIMMIDQEGTFTYVDPRFRELFGYNLDDIPNAKTWYRKAYPDRTYRHWVISCWIQDAESAKPGQGMPRIFTVTCKDGTHKIINFIAIQLETGEYLVTCEDITERKQAEEALRESENQYRTFFNTSRDCVFITSIDGRWIDMNDAAFELFGYSSRDELMQIKISDLYTNVEELTKRISIIAEHGYSKDYPVDLRKKDGGIIHTLITSAARYDADGNVIGFMGTIKDITERKRAEEALRQSHRSKTILNQIASIVLTIPDEEMYGEVLAVVLEVMKSKHGIFGYIGDNGDLITPSLTRGIWSECQIPGKSIVFPSDTWGESLWGKAIREKKSCYSAGPFWTPEGHVPIDNFLTVPIVFGKGTIGLLSVANKEGGYTEGDKEMQESIANFISPILNARLQRDRKEQERKRAEETLQRSEEQARQLAQENAIMAEIGRIISSTTNIEEVYRLFSQKVMELIPFDRIGINLIDLEGNMHTIPYVEGFFVSGRQPGDTVPMAGTVLQKVFETRRSIVVRMEDEKELAAEFPGLLPEFRAGSRSGLTVPLISRGEVIGGLALRSKGSGVYTERNLRIAESIGDQIAGAIANATLYNEQKKVEGALRESEERLRLLFDEAPIGYHEVDTEGRVIRINRTELDLLGYSLEDVIGQPIWRLCVDEEEIIKSFKDKIAGNEPPGRAFERRYRRKDGTLLPVLSEDRILRDEDGRITGIRTTIQDITDRKRVEEERQRLEERLSRAEKMEALGTLSGGVAHDLNNVLGVLVGYSELLLMKMGGTHPLRSHVSYILQASQKAAAIIQDLLTLARRGVSVSEVVNLNDVISSHLKTPEFEKLKAYHPRVTFSADLDKDVMNIKGSPVHLSKTIMNLLSNAAEAITDQGKVSIATENRYLDKPITGYDHIQEGDYVVLRVSDNGKGISAADIGKIFEPFYTKKAMGRSGTGLGLAVVWGTVKDHDGYIDVQSEEGKGSIFTLYFPVTREKRSSDQEEVSVEAYRGRGESILVVDDVKEQRDLATAMLSGLGYQVSAVSSGEEAVTYLKSNRVDLLMLDMIMEPGMDGLETYQKVLEVNPKQKAVVVSGFSETVRVKKAQELGAGAYVRKPYIQEKIGLAIRRELDK